MANTAAEIFLEHGLLEALITAYRKANLITDATLKKEKKQLILQMAQMYTDTLTSEERVEIYLDGYRKYRRNVDKYAGKEDTLPESALEEYNQGQAQAYLFADCLYPAETSAARVIIGQEFKAPHPRLPLTSRPEAKPTGIKR